MRFVLVLLFVLVGGSAWGQCTDGSGNLVNINQCPGPVYYKGPVTSAQGFFGPVALQQFGVTGVTANATFGTLPADGFILWAYCRETAGHQVNVAVGSTSGASDVTGPVPIPANKPTTLTTLSFSPANWFSASAPQTLYLSSASWGGASLNCNLVYQVGP
jgi:hypothetical protein